MIDIIRVKISDLNALVSASNYPQWEVIPISRHRAVSYINNPRASASDTILYLAYIDSKLVGYRTILPDEIYSNGEAIKVGWLSGNWVNPRLRRKGIATALFEAAYTDWEGKLLFTNYALESKAVYDKSSHFEMASTLNGQRFYLRPCLAKILPPKGNVLKALKPLWFSLDFILSIFNPFPIIGKAIRTKEISIEYIAKPDEEVKELFTQSVAKTPTARTSRELDWIFNHPWLVSSPLGDRIGEKYFFSSSPRTFHQSLLKVYRQNELIGFMMLNNKDGFLSTPYVVCKDNDAVIFAKILLKQALAMGCDRVTTYHSLLAKAMKWVFPFRVISIMQQRNFYATHKTKGMINEGYTFNEGDGDCVFV
jgi:GNAT superfamily N-acetyltransferase